MKIRKQKLPFECCIMLAGIPVCMHVRFREAFDYFNSFSGVMNQSSKRDLSISDEEWEYYLQKGIAYNGQSEASLLTAYTSDYLMNYDACIVHAVAFTFQRKAWLITGISGVGKTTQVKSLQQIIPGEFNVICGDRPVIRLAKDGTVIVYPSPWNGKENLYGVEAAPLEGIICLNRGFENKVVSLKMKDAVIPFFNSIIQTAKSEKMILKLAELQTKIMEHCFFYQMESYSLPDSTNCLFESVFRERCQ